MPIMKATWPGHEWPLTAAFTCGLLFGGAVTPTMTNPNNAGDMDKFTNEDLRLTIDEGRRQLDGQTSRLENVQGRAQTLLAIALAALGFAVVSFGRLDRVQGTRYLIAQVVFVIAMAVVVLGVACAAAVVVVRADFDQTDATQISTFDTPIILRVTVDYANAVKVGEITVATRVTLFRMATRYTVWGAVVTSVVYMLTK
jgi:hypothetical protein